jgi:hypothetical protein
MRSLDLALVGNGAIGLLIDAQGAVVWGCFPRSDGDATLCALLDAGHLDPVTGEPWGNFVRTHSMVGLITSAIRLSVPRSTAV